MKCDKWTDDMIQAWDRENVWVPDRNRTHNPPNTGPDVQEVMVPFLSGTKDFFSDQFTLHIFFILLLQHLQNYIYNYLHLGLFPYNYILFTGFFFVKKNRLLLTWKDNNIFTVLWFTQYNDTLLFNI